MFRVMMTLDGQEVPSSCILSGPRKQCDACVGRMRARKRRGETSPRVDWIVLPCIQ